MKDNIAHERVAHYSQFSVSEIKRRLGISDNGLSKSDIKNNRLTYGKNNITGEHKDTVIFRMKRAFINPFSVVLLILAFISFFTDIVFSSNQGRNYTTVLIISVMILLSGIVRFIQEMKSKRITDELNHLVDTMAVVKRDGKWESINFDELVVGDIVKLTAGDRVPADIRVTKARDCFVSQAVITGESGVDEKFSGELDKEPERIGDYINTVFLGTSIIGGSCQGIVLAVGADTVYSGFSTDITNRKNGFDRGSNSIAWVLIKFMALLVPIVFIASGFTKGNWISAFLFALSVAVGLTPELLPMVITACLAKGSFNMWQKKTVVKNINAMQSFGSMDVLCVDKTGTLTKDTLILEYYMDVIGNESSKVLDYAFLNSFYHSGVKNHLDNAILKVEKMPGQEEHYSSLIDKFSKLDELPFDYSRKVASVLLDNGDDNLLISKGSIDDILRRCSHIEYKGELTEIGKDAASSVREVVEDMLEDGMKVLAVAGKRLEKDEINSCDEYGLSLMGYIAFFDAPKKSASSVINKLKSLNVGTKVLTGDNASVAASVCRRLGMDTDYIMTGNEFEKLSDNDAQIMVEKTSVFAELSPKQKAKIVSIFQSNGHTVGFLGDGMNDIPAMMEVDVGISVDTASPSVKEIADVILLKKDLDVLEEGILEGRRAFANMSKYVKITASSNLGNIFAIVVASVFLPFFPMTSIQLLLLNLLYDILCLVLPWDNVDLEICEKPLEWSGKTLSRFMMFFGPLSSVFDIITFVFLLFFLCPFICGGSYSVLSPSERIHFVALFQTGWFLESMWTQIMILHLLRTKKLPFIQSRPSRPVLVITLLGIFIFTFIAMTPVGGIIGLTGLPVIYFVFLIINVMLYLLAVTIAKKVYINKYKSLI